MAFAYPFNLLRLGNSISWWLGIAPWQLFFYVFLPPLLLDAAVRIDWFIFRKVCGWVRARLCARRCCVRAACCVLRATRAARAQHAALTHGSCHATAAPNTPIH